MLLCCLRRALRPSTTGLNLSKLYQHFRERDFPYGLQDSLCTLTLYFRSSVTQLLNKINTRYGWLVRPFPTGTFTLQDTLSFAQRDNAAISRNLCGVRLVVKWSDSDTTRRTPRKLSIFRVKAPVARRPPHRSGREDFPHPVPRSSNISDRQTSQATPRLAHNCCYPKH